MGLLIAGCTTNKPNLVLLFTGDVMLDRGVRIQINKYGVDHLFRNVKDEFHAANSTIVNLECPTTNDSNPQGKKYEFRAEPKWLEGLRKAGVSYASLANNHTIDQGSNGLESTAENLKRNNIIPLGWGKTPATSCEPALIDSNGVSVALFAADYISLENWKPNDSSACPCIQNPDVLAIKIKSFKINNKNRFVIVFIHWGTEYQTTPNEFQVQTAHLFINAGADIIIGSHPHMVQKSEVYKDKQIFYSLGNFIFDQNRPGTSQGEMVKVELSSDGKIKTTGINIQINNCVPKIIE